MSRRPHIDDRVKDAVRAWGGAKNIEQAARALEEARRDLPAELRPQLLSEIAEISAELMVTVLCKTDGLNPDAEPVEVEGEALHPKQAERLGAWLEDQKLTAKALGVEPKVWLRELEAGFTRYGKSEAGTEGEEDSAPATADVARAQRLLGAKAEAFEARPDPSQSKTAGLTGLLAARAFPKKKKR